MSQSPVSSSLRSVLPAALVGVLAGVAGVAGSYAVAGFTPSFVAAPVEGLLASVMPDVAVRYAITLLGNLGQQLNLAAAVLLSGAVVAALAAAGVLAGRVLRNRAVPVVVTAAGTWGFATAVTGDVALAFGAAVPACAVVGLSVLVPGLPGGREVATDRRRVLASGASMVGFGAVSYLLGTRRTPDVAASSDLDAGGSDAGSSDSGTGTGTGTGTDEASATAEEQAARERMLSAADEQSLGVAGMDPLVSEGFYQVDINAVDPTVDAEEWTLSVTGAVEEEFEVDYDELRGMESVDRFETLRCVGESLNGEKMDTALWTGVPVTEFLDRAGPQSDCECVKLAAVDDYYEVFPITALEDGLLAYGMNGEALPRGHGYPVRALVPGHWGEIQVKWITEIEVLDVEIDGYWEKRGWHGTGPVKTVAKLHAVNELEDGRTELGGHTYAGTRGIQAVEVSVDGGDTWTEADLSEPLPAPDGGAAADAWRQWRYVYDPPDGGHEVVVRAVDGTGTTQPREESDPFPSGPSGWVSRTVQ